jgi:hypothetical protein
MALFIRWSDWQRHIQAWETWGRLHPDVSGGCGASSAAALTAVTIAFLLLGPPFVLAQRPQPQITPRCLRSSLMVNMEPDCQNTLIYTYIRFCRQI